MTSPVSDVKTWNDFVRHAAYYSGGAIPDEIRQEYVVAIGIPDGRVRICYTRHAVLKMVGAVSSGLLIHYTPDELSHAGWRAEMIRDDISGIAFWLAAYQQESGLKLEHEPTVAPTGSFWELEAAWGFFISHLSMIARDTPNEAQFRMLLSSLYAVMEAAGEAPHKYFARSLTAWKLAERSVSEYDM